VYFAHNKVQLAGFRQLRGKIALLFLDKSCSFRFLDDDSFVHPNIINPELDELLLRLPKTSNLPRTENFEVLSLFHTG
jgi:hypothetical protein